MRRERHHNEGLGRYKPLRHGYWLCMAVGLALFATFSFGIGSWHAAKALMHAHSS